MPPSAAIEPTVALFATLANPLRLRVLIALGRLGPMSVGELVEIVDSEQSAVSHQLAALKRHRLVSGERDGRQVIYQLIDEHVARIVEDGLGHANE